MNYTENYLSNQIDDVDTKLTDKIVTAETNLSDQIDDVDTKLTDKITDAEPISAIKSLTQISLNEIIATEITSAIKLMTSTQS